MSRLNKKTIRRISVIALMVALIVGVQASIASATDTGHVTATKLEVDKKSQVGFKITPKINVKLLFAKPNSDYDGSDLIDQKAGTTKSYRLLPKMSVGTSTQWQVRAFSTKTGSQLFVKTFTFNHYKRDVVNVSLGVDKKRQSEVYAEIHPKKGGSLAVKNVSVKVTKPGEKAKWVTMTHAYTDEETKVRVYVRTLKTKGIKVHAVEARSVYGSLKNVTAGHLGD